MLVVLVVCASIIAAVVVAVPTPPSLPQTFQGKFTEYSAVMADRPPYANGLPPAPYKASRGEVYYDWSRQAMIEKRLDYCVNIFPTGNDFPCVFHNVDNVSYLISTDMTTKTDSCCIFGTPWHPPKPDFLQNNSTKFAKQEVWLQQRANWFVIPSVPPPAGPFFYAYAATAQEQDVYLAFDFPGVEGWVTQNFFDISFTKPDESIWALPASCTADKVPDCGFMAKEQVRGIFALGQQ